MKSIANIVGMWLCFCWLTAVASATESKRLCVFDFLGKSGVLTAHMFDFKVAMAKHYDIELKVYRTEQGLRRDFDNKSCDMMYTWGPDVRNYNALTGSFEALGMINQTSTAVKAAMVIMDKPKWLQGPKVKVLGLYPVGNVYFVTSNKKIDNVDALIDLPIGVLDNEVFKELVKHLGARPYSAEFTDLIAGFNAGKVPVTAAIALSAEAFFTPGKYYLQPDALFNISMQLLVHNNVTTAAFNQAALNWSKTNVAYLAKRNAQSTGRLPESVWLPLDKSNRLKHDRIMRDIRLSMLRNGFYHPQMLKLSKRLRCAEEPSYYDCLLNDE